MKFFLLFLLLLLYLHPLISPLLIYLLELFLQGTVAARGGANWWGLFENWAICTKQPKSCECRSFQLHHWARLTALRPFFTFSSLEKKKKRKRENPVQLVPVSGKTFEILLKHLSLTLCRNQRISSRTRTCCSSPFVSVTRYLCSCQPRRLFRQLRVRGGGGRRRWVNR